MRPASIGVNLGQCVSRIVLDGGGLDHDRLDVGVA
jgi:hypothetical protein